MENQNRSRVAERQSEGRFWQGNPNQIAFEPEAMKTILLDAQDPLWIVSGGNGVYGLVQRDNTDFGIGDAKDQFPIVGQIPVIDAASLGDTAFKHTYQTRFAYYTGAMANGIASEELVITAGNAGLLASFGAAGLGPERVQDAIAKIQAALPNGLFAFNLINSPSDPAAEARTADLYVKHGVRTVETSAYVDLTVPLVHYRASGLAENPDGSVRINNRVIAKLSRREVAGLFLSPAPEDIKTSH